MHEYERDLSEVLRMRREIEDMRHELDRMIRTRDNYGEVRPGKIKKWSYSGMRFFSDTYISGVAAEAQRLEEVLYPSDLEIAEEVLDDIEEIVNEFAQEELDEDSDDDRGYHYYDYM